MAGVGLGLFWLLHGSPPAPVRIARLEHSVRWRPTLYAIGTSAEDFAVFVAMRRGRAPDAIANVTLDLTDDVRRELRRDWIAQRLLLNGEEAMRALRPQETPLERLTREVRSLDRNQQRMRREVRALRMARRYLERHAPGEALRTPQSEAQVRALLDWFGCQFLYFHRGCFNAACETPAEGAQKPSTVHMLGCTGPSWEERLRARASRAELYVCESCNAVSRFLRVNTLRPILRSRRGRCGEYAQAWLLFLRAWGYEARYVNDLKDHCWVELRLPGSSRWVHTDPCERAFDTPRMYADDWGKRHSYVIAFDEAGPVDVTGTYADAPERRDMDEADVARALERPARRRGRSARRGA